jgi:hypothetical protein
MKDNMTEEISMLKKNFIFYNLMTAFVILVLTIAINDTISVILSLVLLALNAALTINLNCLAICYIRLEKIDRIHDYITDNLEHLSDIITEDEGAKKSMVAIYNYYLNHLDVEVGDAKLSEIISNPEPSIEKFSEKFDLKYLFKLIFNNDNP